MSDTVKEQQERYFKKFILKFILSITVLPVVMWIWPNVVPFSFFEFWHIKGTVSQWIFSLWPLFVWGIGFTILYSILTRNDPAFNRDAEKFIARGTAISIFAGVIEEMTYRWLFFFLGIFILTVLNFFFFGFLGFGIIEWIYVHVLCPLANFTTLGFLKPYLFHPAGWAIGAGLLSANAFFRDGHKYQGIFGWMNSWFIGMLFFWILFQYGLIVCIVAHFLYDFSIFFVRYIDAVIERALGRS